MIFILKNILYIYIYKGACGGDLEKNFENFFLFLFFAQSAFTIFKFFFVINMQKLYEINALIFYYFI